MPSELVRDGVVDLLRERFEVPVTAVVAGAGFGKTTALAQAIRANDADPHGIDLWVACEPGDEEATRLASAIVGAPCGGRPVDEVVGALAEWAPMDVCLFVDDVHLLPTGSSGERLLADLVSRLPPHAHLVLASRRTLPVPLARLRAGQRVIDLTERELGFSHAEVTALAAMRGGDPAIIRDLAGWPALVQLRLSARSGSAAQFLWEEIIAGLGGDHRLALLALSTLGWGTGHDVASVAGRRIGAAAEQLADVVPLVGRDADGVLHVHQLWQEAAERIYSDAERAALRTRALDLFHERGDAMRLGWAAVEWQEATGLRRAARALARDTIGALPVQTAARWIALAPPEAADTPELRLLGLALNEASGDTDDTMDASVDDLIEHFRSADDEEGTAVAIAIGAIIAHTRGDYVRLHDLVTSFESRWGEPQLPVLRFLLVAVRAAMAGLSGDADGVLEITDSISYEQVPAEARELLVRLRVTMLALAGRGDEAVEESEPLLRSHDPHVRWLPTYMRFVAHDPSVRVDERANRPGLAEINARDRMFHANEVAAISAARGDVGAVRRTLPVVIETAASPDTRLATMGAISLAMCQVAQHDELGARATMAAHLDQHPLQDPLCELHLHRHLAVGYVLAEQIAAHWRNIGLRGLHRPIAQAAEELIELRTDPGRCEPLPAPEVAMTSFPLAWSVELAVRAHAASNRDGGVLGLRLAEWEPEATRTELRRWAEDQDDRLAKAAASLLERVPDRLFPPLRIDVLGPLHVRAGDAAVESADLRRPRVRTLLALLALYGTIDRGRAIELMWPEADPVSGRQNLRVTLTRLRRALIADATETTRPTVVRSQRDTIGLAGSPVVIVDLAAFRTFVDDAHQRRRGGAVAASIESLERAFELWRGDPLSDLHDLVGIEIELADVRRRLIDVGLELGEALLVAGRFNRALACAVKCCAADPYDERAHRLAIAANLHRRDRAGVDRAVGALQLALDELGVDPDPATRMLLRRARDHTPESPKPPRRAREPDDGTWAG